MVQYAGSTPSFERSIYHAEEVNHAYFRNAAILNPAIL